MKKKQLLLSAILILAVLLSATVFVGCNNSGQSTASKESKQEASDAESELAFEQVYAYAQEAGYTGTLEDLIAAFKGESAYEIAVKNGYNGSEKQWLNSLKGSDGEDGVSISKITTNDNREIIITLTNGNTFNIGNAEHEHVIDEETYIEREASCEHTGLQYIVCKTCKNVVRVEVIPKAEHRMSEEVVPASCSMDGYTKHTCLNCGYSYTSDYVSHADVEHTFAQEYTFDADYHWKNATCGHSDAVVKNAHAFNDDGVCITCGYDSNAAKYLVFKKIEGKEEYAVDDFTSDAAIIVVIPDTYMGLPVTEINSLAFYNKSSIQTIEMSDNITKFVYDSFLGCSGLKSITISKNIEEIPDNAFKELTLQKVTLNEGSKLTTIGENAFYNCSQLTSIEIPASVMSIRNGAFSGCSSLTSIEIPAGVTSIGVSVFYDCSSLTSVTFAEGSPLMSIEGSAFHNCCSLTSIEIPTSVMIIGYYAFSDCSSLKSIEIPASVTSIGGYAFSNCSKCIEKSKGISYVDKWVVDCEISMKKGIIRDDTIGIAGSAFRDCNALTSVEIPASVKYIGDGAFCNCANLTSVEIPISVTTIGSCAFQNCGLTSIIIPSSVTSIGESAFYSCSDLKSIEMSMNLTDIANGTFSSCGLTSIVIPASVTSIGCAFFNCNSLTSITFEDTAGWYRTNDETVWKNKAGGIAVNVSDINENEIMYIKYSISYYYKDNE